MKRNAIIIGLLFLIGLAVVSWSQFSPGPSGSNSPESYSTPEIPVVGRPTLLDLGANECIPCKMMVPILEKAEQKYKGKAAIIVIDVWKDKATAKRFGIRAIPTQIFFDEEGKEVYRHEGFMGEAEIDRIFARLGVR